MTLTNERIRDAIVRLLNNEYPTVSSQPGRCLQLVREVVEHALEWHSGDFYRRFHSHTVEENTTGIPWARDLQRSLRMQGFGIPFDERLPGDLLFCHQLGRPQGHVVLLLSAWHCLENTNSQRGVLVKGYNRISHIDSLPYQGEWECLRLPQVL